MEVSGNDYSILSERQNAADNLIVEHFSTSECVEPPSTLDIQIASSSDIKITFPQKRLIDDCSRIQHFEFARMVINKNIVLSRDRLLGKVWGYDYMGETNVVDVYVRYLRSKIDEVYGISLIQTVRGVGYVIRDENE